MNEACHNDFCQTTERLLAELGFEHLAPGLTSRVATDWAIAEKAKDVEIIFPDFEW